MKHFVSTAFAGLLLFSGFALAQQPPAPLPPPSNQAPAAGPLTPQMLGEMLRSATTFHELVQRMNPGKLLGPDQHVEGPDGRPVHSVQRTAVTIGAGVGAGAAIGAMTRNQNGVLVGALVGGLGGFILDQIVKHREEVRGRDGFDAAQTGEQFAPPPAPRQFKDRDRN